MLRTVSNLVPTKIATFPPHTWVFVINNDAANAVQIAPTEDELRDAADGITIPHAQSLGGTSTNGPGGEWSGDMWGLATAAPVKLTIVAAKPGAWQLPRDPMTQAVPETEGGQ